jgi:hypothetical protein
MARLTAVLAGLRDVPVEKLCDELLDRILDGRPDDDVAVLAVRCHPEGRSTSIPCPACHRADRGSPERVRVADRDAPSR